MQSFTSPSPSPPPPPYPQLSKASFTLQPSKLLLAFRRSLSSPYPSSLDPTYPGKQRRRQLIVTQDGRKGHAADGRVDGRGKKDNVWSIDNELAEKEREREKSRHRGRRKGRRVVRGKRGMDGRVMVSGAMLMEVESVLQTQEPVIKPAWTTFASSVSGIWKGVGAIFSPITAEMEPLEIGNKNERLYDCYTMSCCKAVSDPSEGGLASQIHRKINWVTLNPY
ncbi:hypothetical protein CRG98_007669, partial [Punica granatum]